MASGGGVEPFRCRCNLLSSQPMAFNLFGPLVVDRALATGLVGSLLPGQVAEVDRIDIEWAPRPKGQYLNDGTSFDVLIEATDSTDGNRVAVGIECKLTEPFSAKVNRSVEVPAADGSASGGLAFGHGRPASGRPVDAAVAETTFSPRRSSITTTAASTPTSRSWLVIRRIRHSALSSTDTRDC